MQHTGQGGESLRAEDRFDTQLPIRINGAPGEARNISAHGIYMEIDMRQELGAVVNFTVEFMLYGRPQRLLCEGEVVRVDEQDGRVRVAARLLAPLFDEEEPAQEEAAVAAASA